MFAYTLDYIHMPPYTHPYTHASIHTPLPTCHYTPFIHTPTGMHAGQKQNVQSGLISLGITLPAEKP